MPLVPQQDIVTVVATGAGPEQAIMMLRTKLLDYPDVRVISITMKDVANPLGRGSLGTQLVAVVETV
jgi:hypothetical protein